MARFNCHVVHELRVEQIFSIEADRMIDAPTVAADRARVLLVAPPPGLEWYIARMDIEAEDGEGEYHLTAESLKLP